MLRHVAHKPTLARSSTQWLADLQDVGKGCARAAQLWAARFARSMFGYVSSLVTDCRSDGSCRNSLSPVCTPGWWGWMPVSDSDSYVSRKGLPLAVVQTKPASLHREPRGPLGTTTAGQGRCVSLSRICASGSRHLPKDRELTRSTTTVPMYQCHPGLSLEVAVIQDKTQ